MVSLSAEPTASSRLPAPVGITHPAGAEPLPWVNNRELGGSTNDGVGLASFPPQAGLPQPQLSLPLPGLCGSARNAAVPATKPLPPTVLERAFRRADEAAKRPPWQVRTDRVPRARLGAYIERSKGAWKALRWLWDHSALRSQRRCSRYLVPDCRLTLSKRLLKPVLKGLFRCHRLDCPVCGAGVAEKQAANMALAITAHYAQGGSVLFVTLTLRHVARQPLLTLLAGLSKSWDACRQHKGPRALWDAYTVGFVRKLEVTFGRNGWHPHLHIAIFLKPGVSNAEADELCASIFTTWQHKLVRQGLGEPSKRRGVVYERLSLEAAHERLSKYMAKDAARELTAAGTKTGRGDSLTTADLLGRAAEGDPLAGLRYLEYEEAMAKRARIQWSDGAKALLPDDLVTDVDDDQLGGDIAVFSDEAFYDLRRNECYGRGPGLSTLIRWGAVYEDDFETFDLIHRKCIEHGIPPPSLAQRLVEQLAASP